MDFRFINNSVRFDENSETNTLHRFYNIGNNSPVNLLEFIEVIENKLGIKADKELLPMQLSDVYTTYADVSDLIMSDYGYKPSTNIDKGIRVFVNWYKLYYGL